MSGSNIVTDTTKEAFSTLSVQMSEISKEILEIGNWLKNGETKKAQAAILKMENLGGHLQNAAKISRFML